jgi:hypothetical protein
VRSDRPAAQLVGIEPRASHRWGDDLPSLAGRAGVPFDVDEVDAELPGDLIGEARLKADRVVLPVRHPRAVDLETLALQDH